MLASPVTPRAQLAVQRSGQLAWLRRQAGELWTLSPGGGGGRGALDSPWQASRGEAAPGSWLCAERDGRPRCVVAPAAIAAGPRGPLTALLWHPRSDSLFAGTAEALEEHRAGGRGASRAHAVGVTAMTLSTDLRRLYAVTPRGELFVVPAMPSTEEARAAGAAPGGEPELLVAGLDRFGAATGLATGPAGLVIAAERAVIGINVRSGSVALVAPLAPLGPLEAPASPPSGGSLGSPRFGPAASALLCGLRSPALAVDHRHDLYLADERCVVRLGGDGSPPHLIAQATG